MNDRMQQWNPKFMNPMLERAEKLTRQIYEIFGDGQGRSQALTQEEALELRNLHPNSTLNRNTVNETVIASAISINSHYQRLTPSCHQFKKIIDGCETSFTREASKQLDLKGAGLVADWAETSLKISDQEKLGKLRSVDSASGLIDEINLILERDLIKEETLEVYLKFYEPLVSTPMTNENSSTRYFTATERRKMAQRDLEGLFRVAREFVIPGYGAVLIEMRDPQLAQEIKNFFKEYPRQLGELVPKEYVEPDTFEKLTSAN